MSNELNLVDRKERAKGFVMDLFGKDDVSLNEELGEDPAMFSDDEEDIVSVPEDFVYYFDSEKNNSDTVNTNVVHQPKTLKETAEEQVIINLFFTQKMFPHLSAKSEYVNRLPLELKYSVWKRILSDRNLEDEIHVQSLEVILDERTKIFNYMLDPKCCHLFGHYETLDTCPVFQSILKLIPNLAPNIENINFTHFITKNEQKEDFKFLLKTCTKLKSLRLSATCENCPILELILTDFNSLDREVQIGLQSIKSYYPLVNSRHLPFTLRKLSNIFIRLPNSENLFFIYKFGKVLNHYVKFHDTPLNVTDIQDDKTNLSTLEIFAKFCPKVKSITLGRPEEKVVENLHKLPLLTEIRMCFFNNDELINYLTPNGKKIKKLTLWNDKPKIDLELFRQLCPNLKNYTYVF